MRFIGQSSTMAIIEYKYNGLEASDVIHLLWDMVIMAFLDVLRYKLRAAGGLHIDEGKDKTSGRNNKSSHQRRSRRQQWKLGRWKRQQRCERWHRGQDLDTSMSVRRRRTGVADLPGDLSAFLRNSRATPLSVSFRLGELFLRGGSRGRAAITSHLSTHEH